LIDPAELGAWLRLLLVPGVGREQARRLLALFGSPQAVVQAPAHALQDAAGARLASAIGRGPDDLDRHLQAVLAWLAAGPSRHVITLGDAAYPPQLLESPDPPLLFYVQGDPARLAVPSIAVVGSRRPSAQGLDNARELARQLGSAGYAVVSGLALGVDGAAHEGALAAGALTLAVVGTGLDRVYPKRHAELAQRIAAQGAIVSEYLPGTPPLAENFPQRNRIIAGLSLGTLVVEAALRSGSLITARLANEAGREVFAVPGSIHAEQSRGCHALIRDGAKLVETAADVLAELRPPPLPGPAVAEPATGPVRADPLLAALGHDPTTLDSLQDRTGWPTAELLARLLELELDGDVARLPGGLYQRRGRA
jgi:DNA processing protein